MTAMSTNSIQFTAIPNGVTSALATPTTASLTVFVTPQLVNGSLAGTAFAKWPSAASALKFNVQFAGGVAVPATQVSNAVDDALWGQIFAAAPVHPWSVPNHAAAGVLSYRSKSISDVVKSAYSAT